MSELINEDSLRRWLLAAASRVDGGWFRQHRGAALVYWERTGDGGVYEFQDGNEHRTYITNAIGNPIEARA